MLCSTLEFWIEFANAVLAGVVSYYICKWLDSHDHSQPWE